MGGGDLLCRAWTYFSHIVIETRCQRDDYSRPPNTQAATPSSLPVFSGPYRTMETPPTLEDIIQEHLSSSVPGHHLLNPKTNGVIARSVLLS